MSWSASAVISETGGFGFVGATPPQEDWSKAVSEQATFLQKTVEEVVKELGYKNASISMGGHVPEPDGRGSAHIRIDETATPEAPPEEEDEDEDT